MSDRKYVFYMHPGSGNHGCEAIVRSSADILGGNIDLYSANIDQDYKYQLECVVSDIKPEMDLLQTGKAGGQQEISLRKIYTRLTGSLSRELYHQRRSMADAVRPGDIWFALGGDNYCYSGTGVYAQQNRLLRRRGAKTVLWGCSLDEDYADRIHVMDDLSRYNWIIARESFSCRLARRATDHVSLIPDPAFTLQPVKLPLPNGWQEGNMIGINASPFILRHMENGDMLLQAYRILIRDILEQTEFGIALIPHAVWEHNDDRSVLEMLYREFEDSGRVIQLPDLGCRELKGYIGRCRMFIGSRTHALIAAYSSCVPALAVGDSLKTRGMAFDLFGTEDNYVVHVQELERAAELKEQFRWLMEHETEVREHLEDVMPKYKERAYGVKEILKRI